MKIYTSEEINLGNKFWEREFLWVHWEELTIDERKQVNIERVLNGWLPININDACSHAAIGYK